MNPLVGRYLMFASDYSAQGGTGDCIGSFDDPDVAYAAYAGGSNCTLLDMQERRLFVYGPSGWEAADAPSADCISRRV